MEFRSILIENKEIRVSVLSNPTMLYTVLPTPFHSINFSWDVINNSTLKFGVEIKFGVMGHFKIPKELKQSENQQGTIFTDAETISQYKVMSDREFLKTGNFKYSKEIEDELVNISLKAVRYNATIIKEKLKGTEMSDYEVIEMTLGFVRTAVRQMFFGVN